MTSSASSTSSADVLDDALRVDEHGRLEPGGAGHDHGGHGLGGEAGTMLVGRGALGVRQEEGPTRAGGGHHMGGELRLAGTPPVDDECGEAGAGGRGVG